MPGKVAESSTSHTDGANVIETLLAEGILTKGRADAKPVAPAPIAVANAALAPVSKQARSVILFRYLRSFVMACVSADRALRKQPLASVVARTAARRLQYDRGTQSFDIEATSKLVAAFNGLRWWYPRTYVCMFDSLALLEFLAHYRLYPRWVFGVTPEPFQAHCWLQEEGLVLNDSVEHVSTYVPVMAT